MSQGTAAPPNAELAARLHDYAQRSPRAYRWSLVAMALVGDLSLTIAQVFPLAVPVLIGMFFVNLPLFYWLGSAAIVFFVWLLRPRFRTTGRAVTREEAPALYAELDALRKKLDVPGRMEVFIDEDFNASAGEPPGLIGVFRRRSVLTLGLPLLLTLTREQLLGVVAHELGHFSRRHGRFGQWIYRARAGWLKYAQALESASPLERTAAWYARRFVPAFSLRSFVYSRMCEYEADRDAASAMSAPVVASALVRIGVLTRVWHGGVWREMARLQLESPEPPRALWQQLAAATLAWPHATQQEWLRRELAAPAGWLDTHPSLAERLRSLGEEARLDGESAVEPAGPGLLGDAWPTILGEFDETLLAASRTEWLMEHLRLKYIVQPLAQAHASTAAAWDEEKQLARAKALRRMSPDEGLLALQTLHTNRPGNHRIRFAYAAALLVEDDVAGVALMETLAKDHPQLRSPMYRRLANYFERSGDSDRAEYWCERLRQSDARRDAAVAAFVSLLRDGRVETGSLPEAHRRVLAEAFSRDACVAGAWLMQAAVPLATAESADAAKLTIYGLMLALDTAQVERAKSSEEQLRNQYFATLDALIHADEQALVRTYLTTEPLPEFDAKFALLARESFPLEARA